VYTVGAALRWLREVGLLGADDALDAEAAGGGDACVTFVPALAGLGAPFWRPEARGAFVGLSLATGRADLLRAVIDGIAAQVTWLARAAAADLGGALASLRADGGLTRSRVLMQAQADLLQVPIEVYPSAHATALGVAAFARLALGDAASAAEAVGAWSPGATYEPQIGAAEADARLARWRRAADAVVALA
jgi:glycerol kinase